MPHYFNRPDFDQMIDSTYLLEKQIQQHTYITLSNFKIASLNINTTYFLNLRLFSPC